jgi:hypothetical protein
MGKKSRQKAKVERGKQKKADKQLDKLQAEDPATAGRLVARSLLEDGADLDSPFAHFVASKWHDFPVQRAADGIADLADLTDVLDREWRKLSAAEKAAFTSPLSFAAAARVRVPTDEASSSSTATAAADEKRDATVSAAASTSAAADRAPPTLKPDEGTAYEDKLDSFVGGYILSMGKDMISWIRSEYGGDLRRLRADADRGEAKAQLAIDFARSERGGDNIGVDMLPWM